MKKLSLLALLSFYFLFAMAQFDQMGSDLQPSANVSATLKTINSPVNLYRGAPVITADLYNLQAKGYAIPINFNYNSSGIKVQDVASSVGLGWSLSANSMISRVVRGLPDEEPNGYLNNNMGNQLESPMTSTTLFAIYDNTIDSEPDMFYYSINGITGKFVFDRNGNAVLLPDNGIRILNSPFKQEMGIAGWVLADLYGNRFELGTETSSRETTTSTLQGENSSKVLTFTSTWYLKTLKTINNVSTINFNYETGLPTAVTSYRKMSRYRIKTTHTFTKAKYFLGIPIIPDHHESETETTDQAEWQSNQIESQESPKYLSSIITGNESAYFYYETNRSDLNNGRILTRLEIKDYTNSLKNVFTFQHDYFVSPSGQPTNEHYRLRLNSVNAVSASGNNESMPLYRFEYSAVQLPERSSSEVDHWGYYNTNPYGHFPGEIDQMDKYKRPDSVRALAGSLRKILFQTGGYREFFMESNRYFNDSKAVEELGGGIRVAKILNVPGYGKAPVLSKYSYRDDTGRCTGKLSVPTPLYFSSFEHTDNQLPFNPVNFSSQNIPNFAIPTTQYGCLVLPVSMSQNMISTVVNMGIDRILNGSLSYTSVMYSPFMVRSSTSFNSLFDSDGAVLGYSEVSIENVGDGKIVTRFTDSNEFPDLTNQMRVNYNFVFLNRISPNSSPFTPATSYAFARGLPKEVSTFDKNGFLLKRVTNIYEMSVNEVRVRGMKSTPAKLLTTNGAVQGYSTSYFNIGYYDYISRNILLKEALETNVIKNESVTQGKITYSYKPECPLLMASMSSVNSDGSTTGVEYRYVLDRAMVSYQNQSEIDAANQLYSEGRIAMSLGKVTKRNGIVLSDEKIGYKVFNVNQKSLILPENIYSNGKLVTRNSIYDEYGNNTQSYSSVTGKTTKIWGYQNNYIIARAENTDQGEIFFEDFEDSTDPNVASGNAYSGNKFLNGAFTVNFTPSTARNYKISYWYLQSGIWQYSGFQPYTAPYTIGAGQAIDQVIVIPTDAAISSSCYDPKLGIISHTDQRGYTMSYSYDQFNRLETVRDYRKNIVKHIVNHTYPQESSPVFINEEKSAVFRPSYCSGPFPITYLVAEGKHFSYTSQSDADQQATNEINAKGQAYANENGKCGVFGRIEIKNRQFITVGDENQEVADIYISFYQDESCTVPAVPPANIDFKLGIKSTWSNGVDKIAHGVDDRAESSATSSANIGQYVLSRTRTYFSDYYSANFEENTSYEYTLLPDETGNFYLNLHTYRF